MTSTPKEEASITLGWLAVIRIHDFASSNVGPDNCLGIFTVLPMSPPHEIPPRCIITTHNCFRPFPSRFILRVVTEQYVNLEPGNVFRLTKIYTNIFPPMALQSPIGPHPPHYRDFTIIHRNITLGRSPLRKWSARRWELYLTTHNTQNRQTSMARPDSNPQSQQANGRIPMP